MIRHLHISRVGKYTQRDREPCVRVEDLANPGMAADGGNALEALGAWFVENHKALGVLLITKDDGVTQLDLPILEEAKL